MDDLHLYGAIIVLCVIYGIFTKMMSRADPSYVENLKKYEHFRRMILLLILSVIIIVAFLKAKINF